VTKKTSVVFVWIFISLLEQCINNLYSCLPSDPIRCDLACNELNYVPCRMIQDRRACQNLRMNRKIYFYEGKQNISILFKDHFYSPYQLLKDVNFYIGNINLIFFDWFVTSLVFFSLAVAIATIVILLFLTGIVILIKYLIRTHRQRSFKSLAQVQIVVCLLFIYIPNLF